MEWLSLHFCFWPLESPPIREHNITRITPRIRLVRGERSLERNSYGSRPWAGEQKIDASKFHNVNLYAKEIISPKLVTIPKTADGQLKFIGGDQVLRTPTLTRCHPSSRRSSRRPSWRTRRVSTTDQSKKSLHIHTIYTEISDILTKISSTNIWENLSWICSTSRLTSSITSKTICYRGPGFIDDLLLVKLVWYITSSIITAGKYRLNTDSSINWMWSADEQARGDPSRNPTNQAMST